MKKFVRGQFVRVLSYAMLILMTIPIFLLPLTKAGHAATGGQQSIVILPFSTTAENAPAKINEQVTQQLISALDKAYDVDRLDSRSASLKRAITEGGDPTLATAYSTAVDINADADARMKAAATLAVHLRLDGIIFGDVSGYDVSKNSKTSIRVNATMVTLQRDASGKYLVDPQNNVIPEATPLEGIGNSQLLPNNKASQDVLDSEAITLSITRMAQQIATATGKPVGSTTPTSSESHKKGSSNKSILIGVGAIILAAVAAGGGGGSKSSAPNTAALSTPQITRIYSDIDSTELKPFVYISWSTTDSSDKIAGFYIYRTSQAFSKAQQDIVQSTKNLVKFPNARPTDITTRSITTSSRLAPTTTRRMMKPSLGMTKNIDDYVYVPGGNSSFHRDYDVEIGQEYNYYVVALANDGRTSDASPSRRQAVTQSEGSVDGLTLALTPGSVKLSWDNTNATGAGYKIYRSSAIAEGTKYISNAKLYQFTDITGQTIVSSLTSDFTDFAPTFGELNSYIVINCDSAGKPMANGPYNVVQIDVPDRDWNGTISAATVATPATSQKLYYSVDTADQLSDSVNIPTDITFTVTGTPTLPAGALVTISTNIGSFVTKGMGQSLVDPQKIIGYLDATGSITIKYQGRAEDPNRNAFLPPTLKELGSPTFTIECNGTSIASTAGTITGTYPILVGPPYKIDLAKTVPAPLVPQNESMDVLFQNASMMLTATVKDISGQTVLSGMPIWFVQSWDKLDDEQVGTIEYFQAVKDWGIVGTSCTYTDGNGVAQTDFSSFHSGKYTLKAFALRKNANTNHQMLTDINTNSIGGLTPDIYTSVKDYILPMTSDAGDVTAATDILCKTYAHYENWHLVSVSNKRISCGSNPTNPNGDQATTVKYMAEDEDGKRVLPGVFFSMSPYRFGIYSTQNAALTIATVEAPKVNGYMVFNESGEASFILRGNNVIGGVGLRFDSQKGAQPQYSTPSPVVYMYGPYLRETVASSIWFASPQNNFYVQRIAGASDTTATTPNQVVCNVVLRDAQGNPFPAGYYVQITNSYPLAIAWTNGFAETSTGGTCSFTYTGPSLYNEGVDQIRDNFVFTVYGENKEGADVRSTDPTKCTPGYEEFGDKLIKPVIYTEHPKDNSNLSVITPYSTPTTPVYIPFKSKIPITVSTFTGDNVPERAGYQVSFSIVGMSPNNLDTALSSGTAVTDNGGVASVQLNTGINYGTLTVYAYYDDNNDGTYSVGDELIATTGLLSVGLATPQGLSLSALSDNSITIQWTQVLGNEGYTIESSLDGTNFFDLTTVGKDVTLYTDTSYVGKNLAPNQKIYYRVYALRSGNVRSNNSANGNITLLVQLPASINLIAKGTSSTTIHLTWTNLPNLGITAYEFDRATAIDAFDGVTDFSTAASPYDDKDATLVAGDTYYYRVRAVNTAGVSAWTGPVYASGTLFPAKPISVTATPISNTSVTISWANMHGATHYLIMRDDGSGYIMINDFPAEAGMLFSSYTDTLCKGGSTYNYVVIASNIAGTNPANGTVSDKATALTMPDAPTGIGLTLIGTKELAFSWNKPLGADGYIVYRSTTSTGGWNLMNANVTAANYDDKSTSLGPATNYYYKVVAFNKSGNASDAIFGPYMTYPQAVTIAATPISNTEVTITWTSQLRALEYRIECDVNDGQGFTFLTTVPGNGVYGNPMSYTHMLGVFAGSVSYRVTAVTEVGRTDGSVSNVVTVTLMVPAKPTWLAVRPIVATSDTALSLTWNAVPGATKYNVFSSTSQNGPFTQVNTTDVTTPSYSNTGLKSGTMYYYYLTAINGAGTSVQSDVMSGYTLPAAVPTPTAQVDGHSIMLYWSAPVTPAGTQLTYYLYRCAKDGTLIPDPVTGGPVYQGSSPVYTYWPMISDTPETGAALRYKVLVSNDTKIDPTLLPGNTATTNIVTAFIFPNDNWVRVSTESNTSLKVAWDNVIGSDGKDATYTVERSLVFAPTVWTKVTDTDTDPLSFTDSNLTSATTYMYRVSYTTVDGTSTGFMGTITYPSATTFPDMTTVTVGTTTSSEVNLSWVAEVGTQTFVVQRSVDKVTWNSLSYIWPNRPLVYRDTTVSSGTTYYYRVVASQTAREDGGMPSNPVAALVLPGAGWVTLTPMAIDQIGVTWKTVANATGYTVERATSAAGPWTQILNNLNQLAVTDTGLTAATTYFYRVAYTTADGTSQGYMDPVTSMYPSAKTYPSAVNLTLKPLTTEPSTTIPMYWTASPGSSQYQIWRSTEGGPAVYVNYSTTVPSLATPYIDTNLTEGTLYTYYIIASCEPVGTPSPIGSKSNEVSVTTKPSVPTGCSANGVGFYSVKITWNDVKGETGYRIERREVVKGATPDILVPITPWQNITMKDPSDPTYELPLNTTSYVENGLKSNTMYQYQIAAFNASGESNLQLIPGYAKTLETIDKPTMNDPTPLTARSVSLSWGSVTNATNYEVQQLIGGIWTKIATTPGLTYTVTGLTPATSYSFQVIALSATNDRSDPSVAKDVTTYPLPNAPVLNTITAADYTATSVTLNWTSDVPVAEIKSFRVQRTTAKVVNGNLQISQSWTTVAPAVTDTTWTDTSVANGEFYAYRVFVTNTRDDESAESNLQLVLMNK